MKRTAATCGTSLRQLTNLENIPMKKTVLAVSALALSGAAAAQSSVTLFGIVDATLARGTGSVASRTQLTNSGYNSSRVGFRGVEDMGGGLKAGFQLEAGIANDDGRGGATNTNNQASGGAPAGLAGAQGLTFNRRSTLSLGGNWGELRLGRDYTPQFWNFTVYDPLNTNGVGTNQIFVSSIGGPTNTRASNSITYLWGHGFNASSTGGSGFHAMLQYYLGENASNTATKSDGTGGGARVGYNGGPVSVAAAYASTSYATGDIRTFNVGGSYDFGAARVMAQYDRDRVAATTAVTGTGWLAGVSVPVGVGELRAGYSRYRITTAGNPAARKLALGYVHHLSKRTALYATYAQVRNSGGSTQALNGATTGANRSSSGLDLGIRHTF
jgi:predicted porin